MTVLRSMLGSGFWAFSAAMILNIGGFGFHAIAGRTLSVADYGAVYSLISLFTVVMIPQTLLSPVIARFAAEFRALHDDAHLKGLLNAILVVFGVIGGIYVIVSVAFANQLGAFLHVAPWQIPVVGVIAAVGGATSGFRSFGQGSHWFRSYALSLSVEGLSKVLFLAIATLGGVTLVSAVGSFGGGVLLGFAAMFVPLAWAFRAVSSVRVKIDFRRLAATTFGAAAAGITSISMGYADVLLVKHYFSAHDAGLYAAASLGGKILLFFVGFVPGVLIPHATDRHARGERTRETLFFAMAFVAVASIVGVVAYHFAGSILLRILVGPHFDAAVPLVTGYAAAMACLAGTTAFVSYGIATHRLAFALPIVVGTLLTLGSIIVWHATLHQVILEMVIGNAVVCGATGLALIYQRNVRTA